MLIMNYLPETEYLAAAHNISSVKWMHEMTGRTLSVTKLDLHALQSVPKDATDGASFIAQNVPDSLSFNAETRTWFIWNGRVHTPLTTAAVPTQLIDILGYAYKDLDTLLSEYLRTAKQISKADNRSDADRKSVV